MNVTTPVVHLDWDSRLFGFGVARIGKARPTKEELRAALDHCRTAAIVCLYFLADSDDCEGWANAIEAGFQLIDIRVELTRRDPALLDLPVTGEPAVDLAAEADLPALLQIARSAFTDSRFYRDNNFPPAKADELFALWTERGVREPGYFTVVWRYQGVPAAFLTGRANGGGDGRIDLVAVSDAFRGRGVGAELLAAGLSEFRRRGCSAVSVATQGANLRAQRLYQAHGFRTRSVKLWFHLWNR